MKRLSSQSNKIVKWTGAFLIIALVLSACQAATTAAPAPTDTAAPAATATSAPQPTTVPTTAPASASVEATVNVATDPTLGMILVDGNGMTLYAFGKDTTDKSNCAGNCLNSWPPLLTQGNPVAGSGVDASMFGNASLPDGTKILTYNHMPLYRYSKDAKPGDVNGQNVGKLWYVVGPDGKPIGNTQASATPTPTTAPAASAAEATINVATDAKLGKILVDGKGMTLYIYTKDTADKSTCTGSCAKFWPPLLTQGYPILGPGVDSSMIGNATLADGTLIVTYNHMPLYYFAKDTKPGDTNGQKNQNVWFVIGPDGKTIGQ